MKLPPFPVEFGRGEGTPIEVIKPKIVVPWMRKLKITLGNGRQQFAIGDSDTNVDLTIDTTVTKIMSPTADSALIKISNLTYKQVIQIITGEFYDVKIECGYRNTGTNLIFKGGVMYIGNELNSDRTNTISILCGSELVAKYGRTRLNLSFTSGINLFSALRFVCRLAGIPNTCISESFKTATVGVINSVSETPAMWIEKLMKYNKNYVANADSSLGATLSLFEASKSGRKIQIANELLSGGYPKLTSDGVSLSIFPTINIQPGDTILLDNSIIDISNDNLEEQMGYYLDMSGEYVVYEVKYTLQNRGSNFSLHLSAKSRSSLSNIGAERR